MIAACPECRTQYRVEPQRLSEEGVRLRCTRCQTIFRVRAPQASAPPAAAPEPVAAPPAAAASEAPHPAAASEASRPAPASEAPPTAAASEAPWPAASGEPTPLSERLVLVATPETENAKRWCEALRGWGLEAESAHDGVEAILKVHRRWPAAVVLDPQLPKMFGFQVCEVIKRNDALRRIGVVLIGAIHHPQRYRRSPSELYGADAYVEEPDLPEALAPILRDLGLPIGPNPVAPEAPAPVAPEAPAPPPDAPTVPPPVPADATMPPTPAAEVTTPPAPPADVSVPPVAPAAEVAMPPVPPAAERTMPPVPPAAERTMPPVPPAAERTMPPVPPAAERTMPPVPPAADSTMPPAAAEPAGPAIASPEYDVLDPDGMVPEAAVLAEPEPSLPPAPEPSLPPAPPPAAVAPPSPEPAAPTPEPVASMPEPVASTPEPVASTPEPVAAPAPPVASAPAPAASTSAPEPAADPEVEQAERLARIIISDVVLYNEEKFRAACAAGNVLEALEGDMADGRAHFASRVPEHVRNSRDFLADELMRVAKSRGLVG